MKNCVNKLAFTFNSSNEEIKKAFDFFVKKNLSFDYYESKTFGYSGDINFDLIGRYNLRFLLKDNTLEVYSYVKFKKEIFAFDGEIYNNDYTTNDSTVGGDLCTEINFMKELISYYKENKFDFTFIESVITLDQLPDYNDCYLPEDYSERITENKKNSIQNRIWWFFLAIFELLLLLIYENPFIIFFVIFILSLQIIFDMKKYKKPLVWFVDIVLLLMQLFVLAVCFAILFEW